MRDDRLHHFTPNGRQRERDERSRRTYSDGVAQAVNQISKAQAVAAEELKAAIVAGNQTSLLQRFVEPAEIVNLALYLASPLSSATNGAALRADDGVLTAMIGGSRPGGDELAESFGQCAVARWTADARSSATSADSHDPGTDLPP